MRRILVLAMLLAPFLADAQKKSKPERYARSITADDMKKHLYVIAGAEMEGRETATEGQRKAASYIENQFKSFGLLPGNHGSYQMKYPVYRDTLLGVSLEINGQEFEPGKDYFVPLNSNHTASFRFGEVVFAGYGISDSTRDDYKNIDARGKLVMVLTGNPPGKTATPQNRRRFNPYTKQDAAMQHGAAAILIIDSHLNHMTSLGNMYVNAYSKVVRPNSFVISEKIAEQIMGDDYKKAKAAAAANTTIGGAYPAEVNMDFSKSMISMESSNVLGLLEGTDLKDEYVLITAHYDHLGKRDTVIYYGADDDGSGTVSVLELAEAFSKAKAAGKGQRRSILFMTVSGEEKGLWGSDYYANHPVFPLTKTSVDLNIDMVGRIDPSRKIGDSTNYIYVVGDDKLSSDLRVISEAVNKKNPKLELDYKFNDPNDSEFIYYRSDHYNFARKGVPIIFYFSGLHRDYHRPTDTPDKINYDLMHKRAQLVFYTAWDMANRDTMLKRDRVLEIPPSMR